MNDLPTVIATLNFQVKSVAKGKKYLKNDKK